MRILIIGSGGREHALAWKLRQNPAVTDIHIAPGNGGTAEEGTNVPLRDDDIPGLMRHIVENNIDFVVPGPELPLVKGITDACRKAGVPCFGPDSFAARLEGSKVFAKNIMREAKVPTADFGVFTRPDEARAYVESKGAPIVIKADGLAAGKGVVVAKTVAEAFEAIDAMLVDKIFGVAGETIVIEEALAGEEVSFLCICAGETAIPLPSAQDHKAAYDGDTGPNTGGMGAYSPAPLLPEEHYDAMMDLCIRPILKTLAAKGHPFTGVLYAGLMMTQDGPRVLEYNVRFGDPECQPLLMRLEGDLLDIMLKSCKGKLADAAMPLSPRPAVCVVVAAEGYPGKYETGMPIRGIETAEGLLPGTVKVFQAGTAVTDGMLTAKGGRILGVTATGETLAQAQRTAYEAVAAIDLPQSRYRNDIGQKALNKVL